MNRIATFACLTALLILVSTGPISSKAPTLPDDGPSVSQLDFVRGRILVKFHSHIVPDHARQIIAALGARNADEIPGIGVHILELPSQASENAFVQAFQSRPEVEFAELDRVLSPATVTPNDPWYANTEWHLRTINGPIAWDTTTGSSNIVIAILDTGVNSSHPDLALNMVSGWNIYNNNSDTSDITGHGTLVAGTAAAVSNNGIGVASVAWNCRLMPIRISDASGYATYSAMASGLTWAADHGARVANLSFDNVDGQTVTASARYFQQKGGVVITASGNSGAVATSADNASLINVSGTDINDSLYSWSNRGNNIDLAAPGYVYTTNRSGGYTNAAGTSVSAPIVAGVAALVLSVNPGLTAAQVSDILKQSADDLGTPGWDSNYGWGRVNAARAVQLAGGGPAVDTLPPTVQFSAPISGSTLSGSVNVVLVATDNVGVSTLKWSVDGILKGSSSGVNTSTFTWDSGSVSNGNHVLSASATDWAGNVANTTLTVNVQNQSVPPTITITSPTEGSSVSGTVSVYVNAVSNAGVARVELYVDGKLKGTTATSPYTIKWNTRKEAVGSHTLHTIVYDTMGNLAQSQSVKVLR